MQLFVQPDYYVKHSPRQCSHSLWLHWDGLSFPVKPWHELARRSLLCMSTHAKRVHEATVHPAACHSLVCLVTRSSNSQKVSCCAYCQRIQLQSSSLSLSFTPTLKSGSSTSRLFPRLSWSTHQRGHRISWNIKIWMRSFEIYGKWSVQASIDTHTCSMQSR